MIERIKQLIAYLNLTQSAFADRMGMKQQNLSRILNGKVNIGDGVINKIILSYDVNKEWLIEGKGKMLKSDQHKYNEVKMIDPNLVEVIKIPVKAKAGYLDGYNDETFLKEMPVVVVQVDKTFHGKYRCFEVEGDSMNDGTLKSICDGDTILCREVKRDLWCYKLHYKQWMFVINHVEGLLVKQIVDHDLEKGTITCHSLNPIYGEDFVLNLNDVRELYNVIKITDRNLKL